MNYADLQKAESLILAQQSLQEVIEKILEKYNWRSVALHPEMKAQAILKRRRDYPGTTWAEAKEAVETFLAQDK